MADRFKKDITFVIATRKGSKRIKNKNIRKFGNSSLLEIKLKQIKRIIKRPIILLSSDCKTSQKIGKKNDAIVDIRPKKFATDNIPMKAVYKYLAKKVNTQYICYLHVTSPFLKDKTLKQSIAKFFQNKKKCDSLASVTPVKEYLWYKNKPVNYNPKNHPRSQTLPEYVALNFAVNIVSTTYMRNKGRIVGENFYPINLDFPESLDIDNQWQFNLGNLLAKKNWQK